ncbi:MAG TPA: Na+/H+ antiporter [Candidatus Acidoferrum sp.]|nr:Na+/H+ antiporter [Candidatus Acidoferrum sp.]
MRRIDVVVALLFAVIPLVVVARRANIAYPIVLVLGGLALGFAPGLPAIHLPPDVVLVVFLPPLLYWEALSAPIRTMRAQAGIVRTLVVGLVIATTIGVALVAHAIVPHMPWAAAFVLGAIVAPTDSVAFSVVAKRLAIPHRTVAVIEAESLLNDGTALVLYASAVAAVVSGSFALRNVVLEFVVSSLGAIALGIVVGLLVRELWRHVQDTDLQIAISVLAPFLAYLPAERFGISAVLAVVTTGLFVNRFAPSTLTAEARERSAGFWQTIAFLMNALIFMLVGLQLHPVLTTLAGYARGRLLLMALAIAATVIAIRIGWLFAQRYVLRLRYHFADRPSEEWKHRLIASWAGFRGGVSLAMALALPLTVASGADFPRRQLTIFLTFGVILATLVGGGLALPWLVRQLRLESDDGERSAIRKALASTSQAALARLRALEGSHGGDPAAIALLRRHYEQRQHRYAGRSDAPVSERDGLRAYEDLARELIAAERAEMLGLQRRGTIDSNVLARVEALLDLEELELNRIAAVDEE